MSKIDCSNIFNFISEWERRRKTGNNYTTVAQTLTSIENGTNGRRDYSVNDMVEGLQKWSDEHPRQTRKEKFIQMCKDNGFERILHEMEVKAVDEECMGCCVCLDGECNEIKAYWNEVID